ncbi:MAG: hypothetical protein ACRD4O_05955 [Bryobacteraceae bacterium]
MTAAATYPAAVISMAVLRIWKGSLLEENISRTGGSIGQCVASGAIFIPAFLMARTLAVVRFSRRLLENHRAQPSYMIGLGVLTFLALVMIRTPLASAGSPDGPAPPSAVV